MTKSLIPHRDPKLQRVIPFRYVKGLMHPVMHTYSRAWKYYGLVGLVKCAAQQNLMNGKYFRCRPNTWDEDVAIRAKKEARKHRRWARERFVRKLSSWWRNP